MFLNREEAGKGLAKALSAYKGAYRGLVLALPRGGVPVGAVLSRALELPLDVFISIKLRHPDNPEVAIGALTETGHRRLDRETGGLGPVSPIYLQKEVHSRELEVQWRRMLYRGGRSLPTLENRCVILVDDGVATGATFVAALEALRRLRPKLLVAAIPVGPLGVMTSLEGLVDDMAVLYAPERFTAVGAWYREFNPVSDAEVLETLSFRRGAAGPHRKLCAAR